MLADNQRGISLRNGHTILDNNTAIMNNSWISTVSRPTCDYCYGSSAIPCTGTEALRLLVTSGGGSALYYGDGVSQGAAFDSKAFIFNTAFENYKTTYSGQPSCSNNVVFKPNPGAIEFTGSHHLFNTSCTNCNLLAYGNFTPTFSMCGNMTCTGFSNYLIQDHTGNFLGFNGTILPNNTWIGDG